MTTYNGFIGSYTRKESTGIRKFNFRENAFEIEDFYSVENPTYLALDDSGKYLYASMSQGDTHGVMSMNLETNEVKKVLFKSESTPAHISIFDHYLLASNYHDGKVDLYQLKDHMLTSRLSSITHMGNGPNRARQEASHIHFALKNPHNNDILVCDLGTDQVYVYQVKDNTLVKTQDIFFPGGSGPRHLIYAKNKNLVYVLSELTSEVFVLAYEVGAYTIIQSVHTLPENYTDDNTGAAIRIHPNQKYLYISNRGHDSLSTLKITDDGKVELLSIVSCHGDHPRDFNLTPDGKYLLSAQMNSQDLTLFKVNEDSGELSLVKQGIKTPEPVSIVFL